MRIPAIWSDTSNFLWLIVVHLLFGIVGFMGFGATMGAVKLLRTGQQPVGVALLLILFGLFLIAIGVGFFYHLYVSGPARKAARDEAMKRFPDQPWMLRADWASRRMTDRASLGVSIFMWIWCGGWWGAIALIWSLNSDKIIAAAKQSYGEAALGMVFPICGLIGVAVASKMTLHWWRYGHSMLRIDTLPGYLGDRFRGSIAAKLLMRPASPLIVQLVCEEVLWVTRSRGGRTSRERTAEVLHDAGIELEPNRVLWSKNGATTIPIDVALPAQKPPSDIDDEGNGIVWTLCVRTTDKVDKGLGYSSQFEIPVFARG